VHRAVRRCGIVPKRVNACSHAGAAVPLAIRGSAISLRTSVLDASHLLRRFD
jgi:hypothetical protein